jgi:Uma2 family endonuclease
MPRASTARTPDEQTDRGGAIVSVQNLLLLPDYSGPQPDVAVLRPREDFYAEAHPKPGDVLLLIEVSDTTLRYDREVKLPLYALAGIPEVSGSWTSRTRRS